MSCFLYKLSVSSQQLKASKTLSMKKPWLLLQCYRKAKPNAQDNKTTKEQLYGNEAATIFNVLQ